MADISVGLITQRFSVLMVFPRHKSKTEYNINIPGFFPVISNHVCRDVYVKFKWAYFLSWCYYKDLYPKLHHSSGLRRTHMSVLPPVFRRLCRSREPNHSRESHALATARVLLSSILIIMRNLWNSRVKKSSESSTAHGISPRLSP